MSLQVAVVSARSGASAEVKRAARLFERGQREAAMQAYSRLRVAKSDAAAACNQAALAIALGLHDDAIALARQALKSAPGMAQAANNMAAACVRLKRFGEAEAAFRSAIRMDPSLVPPVMNLASLWMGVGRDQQSLDLISAALLHGHQRWDLALLHADVTRRLRLHDALRPRLLRAFSLMGSLAATAKFLPDAAHADVRKTTADVMVLLADMLQSAGFDFQLIGSTLLALVRDGDLFPHEKDIDIAMPGLPDPELVWALFGSHPDFTRMARRGLAQGERMQVMGMLHKPTGVAIDVLFPIDCGDHLECGMGWPDDLRFLVPFTATEKIQWRGRDWSVPAPIEEYFALAYGQDWRSQTGEINGQRFDKRYLEVPLMNAMLADESRPRAINAALMRLAYALRARDAPHIQALCWQINARERFVEVDRILEALPAN